MQLFFRGIIDMKIEFKFFILFTNLSKHTRYSAKIIIFHF